MYHDYIKPLHIKTYQEDIARQYYVSRKEHLHLPSFSAGLVTSIVLFIVF